HHPLLLSFFSTTPSPTQPHPLSLHDALPISARSSHRHSTSLSASTCASSSRPRRAVSCTCFSCTRAARSRRRTSCGTFSGSMPRSEEHTSELQSLAYLVCRLLLEKKKKNKTK